MPKLIECPVTAKEALALITGHPGHELNFARQSTAGAVHVLRPWVNEGMSSDPDRLQTSGLFIPAGILGWSMCGIRLILHSVRGYRVSNFRDEDLCARCHELLGDQAVRCFGPERPEMI